MDQDAVQGQLFASRFSEDELVSVSKNRLTGISFRQRESLLLAPCMLKPYRDIRQRLITSAHVYPAVWGDFTLSSCQLQFSQAHDALYLYFVEILHATTRSSLLIILNIFCVLSTFV